MIHLTDINEFEIVGNIAKRMGEEERELFRANTGQGFDPEEFLVSLAEIAEHGHHHIMWSGEKPVALVGFIPQRPGSFRTWFIAPDDVWEEHGRDLTDACAKLISDMLAQSWCHRIETVTLAKREKARAWYERIGLTYESTLRGYGANGEEAVMYVAVRDVEQA